MALEIERKFLVKKLPDDMTIKYKIKQGYLTKGFDPTVRVRIVEGDEKQAWITCKSKNKGAVRQEYEYEIPYEDGFRLLSLCHHTIIEKVRYEWSGWEIDIFEGANEGLILAEYEMNKVNQKITIPSWVGREVTNSRKYYNINLAIEPKPRSYSKLQLQIIEWFHGIVDRISKALS